MNVAIILNSVEKLLMNEYIVENEVRPRENL